ncbi:putative transmembrane protein [Tieghemostelium lacteum]|uniref:Putative transmembrane protein n=1 Tax=Tieghemostelium lacteum TaxID=361077 RepID=A0A152A859_TIELA|nr:putative transmembrane protein [Tieghemostelium lacteum]|eukprot:KYR02398.1 putative transmembrane protein [Tieghemostelium lacteum]
MENNNIIIDPIHIHTIRSRSNSYNSPRGGNSPRNSSPRNSGNPLSNSGGIPNNNFNNNNNNNNNGSRGNTPRGQLSSSGDIIQRGANTIVSSPLQYEMDESGDSISTSSSSDSEIESEKNSPDLTGQTGNLDPKSDNITSSISDDQSSKNTSPDQLSPQSKHVPRTISTLSNVSQAIQRTTSKFIQMDEMDDYGSDDDSDDEVVSKSSDEEKVGIEMRELSLDKITIDKERQHNKEMDKRRNSLPYNKHLLEILVDYSQSLFIALLGAIFCMILAYAFSTPDWILKNNGTVDYFNTKTVTFLISFFFIMGLALFTFIQFISVYGIKRMLVTKFYLWVFGVIGLFLVVPFTMWSGGEPFWFWLGDIILLLIGYTGLCFVMGWVGKSYQTLRERRNNGLAFLGTEVLVSATALVYGMFLIQLYSQFSNTAKIAWRLIVHPIYFEILMMIPVRMLVTRQMEKKGVNIMHTLAVVHAQAHISTLGRMMISTINEYTLTIVSVLLLNIGKLAFRSSVHFRDRAAGIVINKVTGAKQKETKKFVRAVGLYTEMIMENASIPASAFTMWAYYNVRGLFFFPYPSQDGVDVPFTLGEATINVAIQLGFAFVFDFLTLYINERYIKLPLDRAWRKMKGKWLPFFGFLLYGVGTMGMVGVIWMACKLPRFLSCSNLDICTCKFVKDCDDFAINKLHNNATTYQTDNISYYHQYNNNIYSNLNHEIIYSS